MGPPQTLVRSRRFPGLPCHLYHRCLVSTQSAPNECCGHNSTPRKRENYSIFSSLMVPRVESNQRHQDFQSILNVSIGPTICNCVVTTLLHLRIPPQMHRRHVLSRSGCRDLDLRPLATSKRARRQSPKDNLLEPDGLTVVGGFRSFVAARMDDCNAGLSDIRPDAIKWPERPTVAVHQ